MDGGISAILAVASMAATATGAVVSARGAREQANAAAAQANYQAAVARNNQTIASQYAQAEIQRGQVLEQNKRMETAQRESAIRAAVGASGLDPNSGTPLRLQSDAAMVGEQDALTLRANAARAAYGYTVEGLDFGARASLLDSEAENASRAGSLGMWSSIIGGAASVSDKWLSYRRNGFLGG